MRSKTCLIWLVILMLLLGSPMLLVAQEALTQIFTSADGTFAMRYTDGWTVTEENDLIRFSSDQAFMQINFHNYGMETTPLEVLEIGASTTYGFSEPEHLIVAGYSALRARGLDQLHTVINLCEGMMALAIGYVPPGAVDTYEPTFAAMLNSMRYGDAEPQVCRGTFDGLVTITASNAAQVSPIMTFGDAAVPVLSVAFSPDGRRFAAGMLDGSVHLWSAVTGEEQAVLTGHANGATSVAFNISGYLLATGAGSGQVRLWDATTGEGNGFLQKHAVAVESIAFAPTNFQVASGASDGEVRLWDVLSRSERNPLTEPNAQTPVMSVVFSPDETTLAAGGGSTIRLFDVESGTAQASLETGISNISSLTFSPDGARLVYGGSDPAAWVWNLASETRAFLEGHDGEVFTLAFSPDGMLIASGDSISVRLWDATTGQNLAVLATPSGQPVRSLAFSPDGNALISGGASDGLVVWGVVAGSEQTSAATQVIGETNVTPVEEIDEETTTSAMTCVITAPGTANLRSGAGTNFNIAGSLSAGQTVEANGQAAGADGMMWYRLLDGAWVRSDVVGFPDCAALPVVTP